MTKHLFCVLLIGCHLFITPVPASSFSPRAGFFIPDSIGEVTLHYKKANNLIVLPVTINDTISLNLILDTGCRNLVLFGKRFNKMLNIHPNKVIEFAGLGSGKSVTGKISLGNKVSIDAVLGESIPVVIVPNQNLFGSFTHVDGIIGYDIFIKFEIELNVSRQSITFRPALTAELAEKYAYIPIRIEDSKPIVSSTLFLGGQEGQSLNILIDTGSSLGLLLKTNDHQKYPIEGKRRVLGRGLNGYLEGTHLLTDRLVLSAVEVTSVPSSVVYSTWPNESSLGMEVLRHYSFVLNYCKGYAGLKRDVLDLSAPRKRESKVL